MKKVLVSLLVLALAMSSVFAAVEFSGSATFGYQLNYDPVSEDFTAYIQGDDGDDTETSSLKLNIADDNGLWNVYIEGNPSFDSSGAVAGDLTLDLMKLFGADSDFGLTLGFNANDRYTGDRAYVNKSGDSWDRVRTNDGGYFTSLKLGWNGLSVAVAAAPKTQPASFKDGADTGTVYNGGNAELVATVMYSGDGFAVSGNYALHGENKSMNKTANNGVVGGAFNVNVGQLANLDFDLGVSASDRYELESGYNVVAATVYGGTDAFELAAEYALQTEGDASKHNVYVGATVNAVENLGLKVYTGTYNVAKWADAMYVGAKADYTIQNVTVGLGVEYAAGGRGVDNSNAYDKGGLNIVPTVKVSF